jgi:hypothetical protein
MATSTRDRSTTAGEARPAAVGGVAFFALLLVNASLQSNAPAATDSRAEVFSYVARHHDRLQVAAVLWGFAMVAAAVWLPGLYRALRQADGASPAVALAAFAGGLLAGGATVTGALVEGTLATRFQDLGPAGARVGWTMYLLSIGATLFGLLLLVAATAFTSLRTGVFPRWLGISSVVLAVLSAVGACTIGSATTGLQAVAGVAILLDAAWILVVSMYLWRGRLAASAA